MTEDVLKDADARMNKTLTALRQELSRVRTGRAHPGLLEQVMVNYYGAEVPLNQAANISVLDPQTLSVSPWDKSATAAIEKAILQSGLGLNPVTTGAAMRVPLPALTEERRKELIKVARGMAENARVAMRNIRRDANHHLKDELKEKLITEDEERKQETQIQKITDAHIKEAEQLLKEKEAELMEI